MGIDRHKGLIQIRIQRRTKSRDPEEREARLEGRGDLGRGLLSHAAFDAVLNATRYQTKRIAGSMTALSRQTNANTGIPTTLSS